MNDKRPLFSIITATLNAAVALERTIRSIESQTCQLLEYIVIDGVSDDATARIVSKSSIADKIFVSEPDNGIYDAMNKGLHRASGEYIIFLNAGDTFHSADTLQKIADAIMNNDFPGIVYGQTDIVDSKGKRLGNRHLIAPETLALDSFKDGMVVCHQAFIVLHNIAEPFNLKYKYSADYEWCIRCLQHSRHNVYIDDVLVDYEFEGTTTRHRRESLLERFRIMSTYYGLGSALLRHIKFLPRYLRRRRIEKKFKDVSY